MEIEMRKAFIGDKKFEKDIHADHFVWSRKDVEKLCPWFAEIKRVFGGWMVYEQVQN